MFYPTMKSSLLQMSRISVLVLLCFLVSLSTTTEAKVQPHTSTTSKPKAKRSKPAQYPELHFQVKRKVLRYWAKNPMNHAMNARIMPYFVKGRAAGFRLVWIRKGSLYHQLGLQSRDILHKINEKNVNVSTALSLYNDLLAIDKVRFLMIRKNKKLHFVYHIGIYPKQKKPVRRITPKPDNTVVQPAPPKRLLKVKRIQQNCYLMPKGKFKNHPNFTLLLKGAAFVPHFQGGVPRGIRLIRAKKTSIIGQLGIQRNDILTHFNNASMSSPYQILMAFKRAAKMKKSLLTLLRKGKQVNITILTSKKQPCQTSSPTKRPPPKKTQKRVLTSKPTTRKAQKK